MEEEEEEEDGVVAVSQLPWGRSSFWKKELWKRSFVETFPDWRRLRHVLIGSLVSPERGKQSKESESFCFIPNNYLTVSRSDIYSILSLSSPDAANTGPLSFYFHLGDG